jgi:serine/threonine protein kinase
MYSLGLLLDNRCVPTSEDESMVVGRRYVLGKELGRGGTAVVHRAKDLTTGVEIAIKRLRGDVPASHRDRALELIKLEYHTLSQLSHPNVVAVYDYGLDENGPYYTMELLDGGDVLEQSPIDWRKACVLARDVCSVLSLLHSRRMVYRDLSPRNIRCTSRGETKLIDFGAMTAMGPTKYFVGTLAMSAPEAIHLQPLDARSDLFSLGATLYYALVGRRPFAARTAFELVEQWRTLPPRPSNVLRDIPGALDALVMDLIQPDPAHRPASAGEVMARLAAIAGFAQDEAQLVSRAYLTTPTLVGRSSALARTSAAITEAIAGKGSSFFVHGRPGTGRSRFLDACVLAAKTAGTTVLRADASDSNGSEYGAIRALAEQLLRDSPELALDSALAVGPVLACWMPELKSRAPQAFTEPFHPSELQTKLQPGLRDWFAEVSKRGPLLLAIDDVHLMDTASAAVIALLSRAAPGLPLCLVATADSTDQTLTPALSSIADTSRPMRLHRLDPSETETVLRSVFGEVPHLVQVAHRIHAIARGRPREIMQLARHLVDRSVIRYQAGVWSLPASIADEELPSNMLDALRVRVSELTAVAAELAHAMALAPGVRCSLDECTRLAAASTRDVRAALTELVAAELVVAVGSVHMLAGSAVQTAVLAAFDSVERSELHMRLADLFERRNANDLRLASHLLAAGADERAAGVLVQQATASVKETDQDPDAFAALLQSLPPNWLEIYARGVELCSGRPSADAHAIRVRIAGIAAFSKVDATPHFRLLYEQLERDAGLDIYATLAHVPAAERLKHSFGAAMQRYAASPERERRTDPATTVRMLSRMVVAGVGNAGMTLSVEVAKMLPDLTPLIPLSPALAVVQQLSDGVRARLTGANDTLREIYGSVIQQLTEHSHGLDATYRDAIRLSLTYMLGALEASMGLAISLERAEQMEQAPLYEVNATLVRMLYHLWQGDIREAQRFKALAEQQNLERMRPQGVDGGHLPRELSAYAASDDLTRVKQLIPSIEAMAATLAGWRPVLHWARAEYDRIRGDLAAADAELNLAFVAMQPEGHLIWADVAGSHIRVLTARGQLEEACESGLQYLAQAEQRGLVTNTHAIGMPLAVALANSGDTDRAIELADRAIAHFTMLGSSGINRFLAHETRARIAAIVRDAPTFAIQTQHCREQMPEHCSGALSVKYERLAREGIGWQTNLAHAPCALTAADQTIMMTQIAGALEPIADVQLRAKCCLEFLLRATGTEHGFLFLVQHGEAMPPVRIAEQDLPESVAALARDLIRAENTDEDTTSESDDDASSVSAMWTHDVGLVYRPVVLRQRPAEGGTLAGIALLLTPLDRPFQYPTLVAEEIVRHLQEY